MGIQRIEELLETSNMITKDSLPHLELARDSSGSYDNHETCRKLHQDVQERFRSLEDLMHQGMSSLSKRVQTLEQELTNGNKGTNLLERECKDKHMELPNEKSYQQKFEHVVEKKVMSIVKDRTQLPMNENIERRSTELVKVKHNEIIPNEHTADKTKTIPNPIQPPVDRTPMHSLGDFEKCVERKLRELKPKSYMDETFDILEVQPIEKEKGSKQKSVASEDVYCICRSGEDRGRMIGCDFCDEWYHTICLNITKAQENELIKKKWRCPKCDPKLQPKASGKILEKPLTLLSHKPSYDQRYTLT